MWTVGRANIIGQRKLQIGYLLILNFFDICEKKPFHAKDLWENEKQVEAHVYDDVDATALF